jgi:hypothetical protein
MKLQLIATLSIPCATQDFEATEGKSSDTYNTLLSPSSLTF